MSRDIPEMTRLKAGDTLTSGQKIEDGLLVHLASARGDVLDGNQYSAAVQTVDRTVLSNPEFTGVNWVLEAAQGDTWRLLNQGDLEHGLHARDGVPRLGHLSANVLAADPMGHWLIYSYGTTGKLMLRPIEGEWLRIRDDQVILGRCARGEEDSALWRLITV